jgi:serine/threonine protein kinase
MSRPPRPGEIVCGYRLLRELGSAASPRYVGTRADKTKTVRAPPRVVVELFPESAILFRNARALVQLRHPKVNPVRDVVVEEGVLAIESEFVDGEWLADLLEAGWKSGAMPLGALLRVLVDVLEGLSALHGAHGSTREPLRLVHGEVAASNVLIGADGIARVVHPLRSPSATEPSPAVIGYLAPEVLLKDQSADARADVFSAGVLLWEMLSRRRLHSATHAGEIVVRLLGGKVPPAEAPKDAPWAQPLAEIARRALSPELASRYATAAEMTAAVRRVAGQKLGSSQDVRGLVQSIAGAKIRARAARWATPQVQVAAPVSPALAPVNHAPVAPPVDSQRPSVRPDTPTLVPPRSSRAPSIPEPAVTRIAPLGPAPRVAARPALQAAAPSAIEVELEPDSVPPAALPGPPAGPRVAPKAPPLPTLSGPRASAPRLSIPTPVIPMAAVAAYARSSAPSAPEHAAPVVPPPLPVAAPQASVPPALPIAVAQASVPPALPVSMPPFREASPPPEPSALQVEAARFDRVSISDATNSPIPDATDAPIALTAPHETYRPPPRSRRHGVLLLVAALLVAVPAIAGLAWLGLGRGGAQSATAKEARESQTATRVDGVLERPLVASPSVPLEPIPAIQAPLPVAPSRGAPPPSLEAAQGASSPPPGTAAPSGSSEAVAPPPLNKKSKTTYYPLGI